MEILLIEPFFTGSHAVWARGYARHSNHTVKILTLAGAHWKWRMHGGALTLADRFLASDAEPDVIVATDMLDLTTFLALTRKRTSNIPAAVYFHENQLNYPWSPQDRDLARSRDRHYGFINFASAAAADRVLFNSHYHRRVFLDELPRWLARFPDHREMTRVEHIRAKSSVLPLGFDFARIDSARPRSKTKGSPLVLWNHRWEYDKNPDDFFDALRELAGRGLDFRVAVLGETFDVVPDAFERAKRDLADRIDQYGYAKDLEDYAGWLWRADILPVTSNHDFFGASVMEALYCGCFPLLPRRVVYPEIVPEEHHSRCLYDSQQELVAKLDDAIRDIDGTRSFDLREVARKFDWSVMAPVYDAELETLAASK